MARKPGTRDILLRERIVANPRIKSLMAGLIQLRWQRLATLKHWTSIGNYKQALELDDDHYIVRRIRQLTGLALLIQRVTKTRLERDKKAPANADNAGKARWRQDRQMDIAQWQQVRVLVRALHRELKEAIKSLSLCMGCSRMVDSLTADERTRALERYEGWRDDAFFEDDRNYWDIRRCLLYYSPAFAEFLRSNNNPSVAGFLHTQNRMIQLGGGGTGSGTGMRSGSGTGLRSGWGAGLGSGAGTKRPPGAGPSGAPPPKQPRLLAPVGNLPAIGTGAAPPRIVPRDPNDPMWRKWSATYDKLGKECDQVSSGELTGNPAQPKFIKIRGLVDELIEDARAYNGARRRDRQAETSKRVAARDNSSAATTLAGPTATTSATAAAQGSQDMVEYLRTQAVEAENWLDSMEAWRAIAQSALDRDPASVDAQIELQEAEEARKNADKEYMEAMLQLSAAEAAATRQGTGSVVAPVPPPDAGADAAMLAAVLGQGSSHEASSAARAVVRLHAVMDSLAQFWQLAERDPVKVGDNERGPVGEI